MLVLDADGNERLAVSHNAEAVARQEIGRSNSAKMRRDTRATHPFEM